MITQTQVLDNAALNYQLLWAAGPQCTSRQIWLRGWQHHRRNRAGNAFKHAHPSPNLWAYKPFVSLASLLRAQESPKIYSQDQERLLNFNFVIPDTVMDQVRNLGTCLSLLNIYCRAQPNGWMDNWVDFVRERRIGHMLRLINDSGLSKLGEQLLPNLNKFFEGIEVCLLDTGHSTCKLKSTQLVPDCFSGVHHS